MMRLEDKVAIVTGATKGIGRVIAARMAAEGAKVVLAGRTAARGEAMVAAIVEAGGQATFVPADIGEEGDVRRVVSTAVETYGALTTLVNNAAATDVINKGDATIVDVTTDAWDRVRCRAPSPPTSAPRACGRTRSSPGWSCRQTPARRSRPTPCSVPSCAPST